MDQGEVKDFQSWEADTKTGYTDTEKADFKRQREEKEKEIKEKENTLTLMLAREKEIEADLQTQNDILT